MDQGKKNFFASIYVFERSIGTRYRLFTVGASVFASGIEEHFTDPLLGTRPRELVL